MRNTILKVIFIAIVFGVLLAELTANKSLTFISKPMIMVWVLVYYLINTQQKNISNKAIIAFIAAWAGDVLLMFQAKGDLFFMLGLGSFLICQLLYATVFLKKALASGIQSNWLFKEPTWLLLLVIYTGSLYAAMYQGLSENLRIPVFVYALAITSMLIGALSRRKLVDKKSFQLIVVGALLFVLSDSLLGLNKFFMEVPYAGFWILLTYMSAQYFIVRGLIIKNNDL